MIFSENVKRMMLDGLATDDPFNNSPFVRQDDDLFMRFDSITVENDTARGIKVSFTWLGNTVACMTVENMRFENDNALSITGIDGKQLITLE